MVAKGHDFPDVTLVGVISPTSASACRFPRRRAYLSVADAGRRPRRTRRALRRGDRPVADAGHYSIKLACAQDFRAFYEKEIEFRRTMRYPPQVAMVNVVVRGRTFEEAMDGAHDLADAARGSKGFVILGPAPAPLTKLRGEHRAQFFLKGPAARRCGRRCNSRFTPAETREAHLDRRRPALDAVGLTGMPWPARRARWRLVETSPRQSLWRSGTPTLAGVASRRSRPRQPDELHVLPRPIGPQPDRRHHMILGGVGLTAGDRCHARLARASALSFDWHSRPARTRRAPPRCGRRASSGCRSCCARPSGSDRA